MKKEIILIGSNWHVQTDKILETSGHKFWSKKIVYQYVYVIYELAKLNRAARHLMSYILLVMDDRNRVSTGTLFKMKFNEFIGIAVNGVFYKDGTTRNALSLLRRKKFLIRDEEVKGFVTVNPKLFFTNDERSKIRIIRLEVVFKHP